LSTQAERLREAIDLHRQGDLDAAVSRYEALLRVQPEDPDLLNLLGLAHVQSGACERGAACLRAALALRAHPSYHNNLGLALKGLDAPAQAEACFRQALALDPGYLDAVVNLAASLSAHGDHRAALALYEQHRDAGLGRADFLFNYAQCSRRAGDLPAALDLLERLIARSPRDAQAAFEHAMVLKASGAVSAAGEAFERLLTTEPDAERRQRLRWYLSQCRLLQGDWTRGWADYPSRFGAPGIEARSFPQEAWAGQPLGSERLLVWAEQGLGDELLFATQLPALLARCAQVAYECDPRLLGLFSRTWPRVDFFPRYSASALGEATGSCCYQVPAGDLPRLLNQELNAPSSPSMLRADPARVSHWRAFLRERGGGRRCLGVGYYTCGAHREQRMPDEAFWTVLHEHAGQTRYVDLQRNARTAGRIPSGLQDRLALLTVDDLDLHDDIEGLAALIVALDGVISIDASVAHLAGSLGAPTAILLSTVHDWRWPLGRRDTPWYPRARLLRQDVAGDWGAPRAELGALLSSAWTD
jgi:tetratricopeptide (TPR) repeat protein